MCHPLKSTSLLNTKLNSPLSWTLLCSIYLGRHWIHYLKPLQSLKLKWHSWHMMLFEIETVTNLTKEDFIEAEQISKWSSPGYTCRLCQELYLCPPADRDTCCNLYFILMARPHLHGTRWRNLWWIATAYSHCDLQNSFSSSHLLNQHCIRSPTKQGRYLETISDAPETKKIFQGPEGNLKGWGKSQGLREIPGT